MWKVSLKILNSEIILKTFTHAVLLFFFKIHIFMPGRVAQSVMCLAIIISTFILLPSAESFKKGCCQLQAKVCA